MAQTNHGGKRQPQSTTTHIHGNTKKLNGLSASQPKQIKTPRPNPPEVASLTQPNPWSPATRKLWKGTWATEAPRSCKLTLFGQVFKWLFESLRIRIFRGPARAKPSPTPHRARTMKPSHEKTSRRHLSHNSTEKLKVQLVLTGFQMLFRKLPNLDFQGPGESEAQSHHPPSQNYEAQQRENFEKAWATQTPKS